MFEGSSRSRTKSRGDLLHEQEVIRKAGRDAIKAFLDSHKCYAVLRPSGKVVVLNTRISIQMAFYALVEHDMTAAPLWDPSICQFVGIFTVTDFIDVLRYYHRTGTNVSSLATRSIADILGDSSIISSVLLRYLPGRGSGMHINNTSPSSIYHYGLFLSADSTTSLKEACHLLHLHSIDFLPIIFTDDMRVLATITYTTILEHVVIHFREQRRLFDDSIYDLGIGTYHEHVVTVSIDQTLAQVLHILQVNGLSAVPVVDENKKIRGIYSRSDITFLATASNAENAVNNLDMTLEKLMIQSTSDATTPDSLHTCTAKHSLQNIFEYFAQWRFNRLIVIDEEKRVKGVVSARDLLAYFLDN